MMGVELVEGRDLFCSGGRVWMRTTQGRRRVDVIYRRVDDDYLDPVVFRNDSLPGQPGAHDAARATAPSPSRTRWATAWPTTSSSTPTCPTSSGTTWARSRSCATSTRGGSRSRTRSRRCSTGSTSSSSSRSTARAARAWSSGRRRRAASSPTLRVRLREDPRGWIAQPVVQLSTIPTLIEDGLRPRHADLRPFAVNDGESRVRAARRAHPRGAARGRAGRQLVAGRRVQGHVGARRGGAAPRGAARFRPAPHRPRPPRRTRRSPHRAPTRTTCARQVHAAATAAAQQQQPSRGIRRRRGARAEPHRGVAVLDRSVRRACRRHRAPARRARADPARGPVGGGGPGLPVAPVRHGPATARPTHVEVGREYVLDMLAYDRFAPSSIARLARLGARERPPRPGDHLDRAVGVPQRDVEPAARRTCGPPPARLLHAGCASARPSSPGSWTPRRRATTRGTSWSLGRSIERADMTARLLTTRALAGSAGPSWTTLLRSLRRARGVPAHVPGRRVRRARGRVPADSTGCSRGRSSSRSTRPRRAWRRSSRRADRAACRRRAAAHRLRPDEPGVPAAHRGARRAAQGDGARAAACSAASDAIRGRYFPSGVAHELGGRGAVSRLRVVHTSAFQYAQRRARVVQRGADDAADPAGADGARVRDRRPAAHGLVRVPRLLGHRRLGVRGADPARVDGRHGRAPRRGAERRPLRRPPAGTTLRGAELRRPARRVPRGHADDGAARGRGRAGQRIAAERRRRRDRARGEPRRRRDEVEYIPRRRRRCTPRRRRRGPSARACARTSRTWCSGALRSIGIPARYVSGYLHPDDEARDRADRERRLARLGRVVGGRVVRLRPDQPRESATTTWSSLADAPTTTCLRCGASSRERAPRRRS